MELLDICDEKGIPSGETVDRDIAHRDGILHRTAHGKPIKMKEKCPLFYDTLVSLIKE